jgi:hypothetical protein
MSNTGNSIKDEGIRELAGLSITSSYQPLGGVFLRDAFRIVMTNFSNGDIYLSTDGVTDMKKMSTISARIMDEKTNDMFRKKGTQWYVRFDSEPAMPSGWVTMEVEYV